MPNDDAGADAHLEAVADLGADNVHPAVSADAIAWFSAVLVLASWADRLSGCRLLCYPYVQEALSLIALGWLQEQF